MMLINTKEKDVAQKFISGLPNNTSIINIKSHNIQSVHLGLARAIKTNQAHHYLEMNRHRFDQLVQPCLIKISLGTKSLVYDRLDLDAWFEEYKHCNGRPAGEPKQRGKKPWDEKEH